MKEFESSGYVEPEILVESRRGADVFLHNKTYEVSFHHFMSC